MRRTFRTLMAVALVTLTVFAACKKDEKEDAPQTPVQVSLGGTSWEANVSNEYTFSEGRYTVNMNISLNSILDFIDKDSMDYFMNVDIEVPSIPSANQSMNYEEGMRYFFDGTNLMIFGEFENEDTGEKYMDTMRAVYDKSTDCISLSFGDAEMEEMMGTDAVVYHRMSVK